MTVAVSVEIGVDALLLAGRRAQVAGFPEVLAALPTVFYPDEQAAVDAAVTQTLIDAQIMDSAGMFDPVVLEWVTVLGRPDVEMAARVTSGPNMLRVSVVRRGDLHVMATRFGDRIVLQPVFGAGVDVHEIVTAGLCAILGEHPIASFTPLTAPAAVFADLAEHYRPEQMTGPLRGLGADMNTARVIAALPSSPRTAEITMITHAPTGKRPVRAGLGVFDSERGRVVARVRRGSDDRLWSTFAPGSVAELRQGVTDLSALLPEGGWFDPRAPK